MTAISSSPDPLPTALAFEFRNSLRHHVTFTIRLRNLSASDAAGRLAAAELLCYQVANELYYLSGIMFYQCHLKVNGKRKKSVLLPNYELTHWVPITAVSIQFPFTVGYYWANARGQQVDRILPERLSEWERAIMPAAKPPTMRLPAILGNHKGEAFFTKAGPQGKAKRRRPVKKWAVRYDDSDPVFIRWLERFLPNGNLAIGTNPHWMETLNKPVISGVRLKLPKQKSL